MDVDELPQFDPNVDYRAILPIHQKRMITFVNHFVSNTVSFLNKFAETCESKLLQFEYKLQKVEASLLILESQLASIPDTEEIVSESLELPEISNEETIEEVVVEGPVASKDPRFVKYFKMVQFGVSLQNVKLKMEMEGLNPDILESETQ